ncbi:MAG: sporulation protein YabP, partial [Clostridia bacterium]|nr:sporulation protein YabP [Clostridia bacterium]
KTDAGDMNIAGECLHITRLDLDNGQVVIEGEIGLIEYEEPIPKKKGSLLSRLFS